MPDDSLLERFRQGDRLALTRLVSMIARGEPAGPILERLGQAAKRSRVVAVTGSGGVGKSTLVGKLIEHLRARQKSVAVLACDPQSPLSGGALLGDRFRMPTRPDDDGVFIRSLAASSGRGALAEHLDAMIRILERFGFDVILIETVGAGQGDTAVHDLPDMVVLVLQPEMGDDLQWEKAGVLEVADVVVIHKADLPGADRVEAQVKAMLGLSHAPEPPVLRTSSKTGEGLAAFWNVLAELPLRRATRPEGGRELLRLAKEQLDELYTDAETAHNPTLIRVLEGWKKGTLDNRAAVTALCETLLLRRD